MNSYSEDKFCIKWPNDILCKDGGKVCGLLVDKFENDDLIKIKSKESAHKGEIYDIIGLDNGIIISCSDDSTIKFWN